MYSQRKFPSYSKYDILSYFECNFLVVFVLNPDNAKVYRWKTICWNILMRYRAISPPHFVYNEALLRISRIHKDRT